VDGEGGAAPEDGRASQGTREAEAAREEDHHDRGERPVDTEAIVLFGAGACFALANVPLLFIRPTRAEQHMWRRLRVQSLRRWITKRRNPGHRHRDGSTIAVASTNIRWHIVLGLVFASLILHPQLRAWPLRAARYALLAGCVAYFIGSLVQRQKIVIAANERSRRQSTRA
jgi:hypothetical protein